MTLKQKTIGILNNDRIAQLCEDANVAIPYPKEEHFRMISNNCNSIFGACQSQQEAIETLNLAAEILARN